MSSPSVSRISGKASATNGCEVFISREQQAASARAASIVSAHTAGQIVSIVTVLAVDQPAAVAVALAVVSDALKRLVVSPTRWWYEWCGHPIVTVRLRQPSRSACQLAKASSRKDQVMVRGDFQCSAVAWYKQPAVRDTP